MDVKPGVLKIYSDTKQKRLNLVKLYEPIVQHSNYKACIIVLTFI
ncbi:MAG: hypothetical protein JWR67_3519 [Mucilaginibacter sp.]|nr:hypothetical protein [Mucilaginibacter sp.]